MPPVALSRHLAAGLLAAGALLVAAAPAGGQAIQREVLARFRGLPAAPQARLTAGPDGNFYGSTNSGGISNFGTLFRLTPDGTLTTLVEFTGSGGSALGQRPISALTLGPDGNFYGAAAGGGPSGNGTVFRLTPAGEFTNVVLFTGTTGANPGASPSAELALGADGNFYGTTTGGGANSLGTVFRLTPAGGHTVLVSFAGGAGGSRPNGGLVLAPDGNFFGATSTGGTGERGTIFTMTPAGVLTPLVVFTGTSGIAPGESPQSTLAVGPDGHLYGVTPTGGTGDTGTVFRVTTAGAFFTVISFSGTGSSTPGGPLALGADGNFYGAAFGGGTGGVGTIFRVTPGGAFSTLVNFTDRVGPTLGAGPRALLPAADGNLYGVTSGGGAEGRGTAFRLTTSGLLATLQQFPAGPERGTEPRGGLFRASDGKFYGTTASSGSFAGGTVFRLSAEGVLEVLADFTGSSGILPGSLSGAPPVQAADGNLYGTTERGGSADLGVIYRVTPGGQVTTLAQFTTATGTKPTGSLAPAPDGMLYGVCPEGGNNDFGTVFRFNPATAQITRLHSFSDTSSTAAQGARPRGALALGTDGNFYGTASRGGAFGAGVAFRVTTAGAFNLLASFRGFSTEADRGSDPIGGLLLASDGAFYGTTSTGGSAGFGTVFRLLPGGFITTIAEFTGTTGARPGNFSNGRLVQGPDGKLYGTTNTGGPGNAGTVFRVDTSGFQFATLQTFTTGGVNPHGGLVLGDSGTFYGVTARGGNAEGLGSGTVYRLRYEDTTRFVSALREAGGRRVRWQGAALSYQVQFNDTLLAPWQTFPGTVTADGTGAIQYLDTTSPAPARRSYRLVSLP